MKILFNGRAIIVGLEEVKLDDFPDLKIIGCNMTSCEHLPLEEMKKQGIKLISLKDYPAFMSTIFSTAEHTMGLILALMRNYKTALNYPYKERDFYKGHILVGKTILLVGGNGRVGRQVRDRAKAFGMKVLIYEKNEPIENLCNDLSKADIISLHIPLENNYNFFTKAYFEIMKPSACIVNTSRDKVIQKGALVWALENKIISGAAVDFCEDEELVEWSKTHNNLILTPHIGGNTHEDRQKTEDFITNQCLLYLNENQS